MSDSTTTHYGLVEPENFGSQNTWGPKLNGNFTTIDTFLWAASQGTTIGVNEVSSAADVTLTNPIKNIQNCIFSTSSKKLILPAMNASTSIVKGGSIIINNVGVTNAFGIYAQDGSTAIVASVSPGDSLILTLRTNATANGTFTQNPFITSSGTPLLAANNLSDVASASTSRTNLGLGTAATQNTGTSGATIPFLNGTNTWTGTQTMTGAVVTVTTQAAADSSTKPASTAFVNGTALTLAAGTTAVTQLAADNSTKVATTAQVQAAIAASTATVPDAFAVGATMWAFVTAGATTSANSTTAGANLTPAKWNGGGIGSSGDSPPSGTWRAMQSLTSTESGIWVRTV